MTLASLFLWLAVLGFPFVYGDDGEKFSLDSDDSEDSDGSVDSASDQSYNGFGMKVYEEGGVPELLVYNSNDKDATKYCLSFTESFEASKYNTSDDYTVVSRSNIDFSSLTWEYEKCNSTEDCLYTVSASSGSEFDSLTFSISTQMSTNSAGEEEYSVKFDIDLMGYVWEDTTAEDSLIFVFGLDDCTDEYGSSGSEESDGDNSSDGDDDDDVVDGDGTDTDDTRRRMKRLSKRLLEDDVDSDNGGGDVDADTDGDDDGDDDGDSGDVSSDDIGISSDDSDEFDFNEAYFVINPTADGDSGSGNVNARLFYKTVDTETDLHIVYSHFTSDLSQDPLLGVDSDKIDKESSGNINQINGMIMSLFVAMMGYILFN